MKKFDGLLVLEDIGVDHRTGVQWFCTTLPVTFVYGDLKFRIPPGTTTDFASVPRWLQWLMPKTGRYTRAAVLHDYLCTSKQYSRFFGDAVFREAMAVLKVPPWRRVLMYYGVRLYAVTTGKK